MEHIGEIVRWLREGAGLSRQELAQATALVDSTIRNVESGRHVPTRATLRKLLRAPCMFTLPELATSEGLSLRLAADRKRRPALQRRRGKRVKR
jgi:transcriptional regulator with XRE-family HTH domain